MEIKLLPPENKSKDLITSIILCAGEGTRINKFLPNIPKPLIKINDKPILEYILSYLIKSNIKSINIVIGHLKEYIIEYIESNYKINKKLRRRILLVDSGDEYKKGPLYSFLSITKIESIMKRDSIFMVLPGDTFLDYDLFQEIVTLIKKYSIIIQNSSLLFYQEIKGINLKDEEEPEKLISILKTEKTKVKEKVKKIEQLALKNIHNENHYQRIVPVFVLGFKFLEYLIDTEKNVSVNSIREIINVLLKKKNNIYAFPVNSKYRFYDIDTKLDLLRLNQKKRGQ
ncbi:MAG: sugar phosphate nucleotidyltransferase [Candidatus Thorarchaeota archaeon]